MKLVTAILTTIMLTTAPALASSDMETGETGLLVLLFLGFGALIIACQLIPSLMLFCAMLKGLFNIAAHGTMPKTGTKPM